MSGLPDAFGLDGLRAAVLRAWRDSPTRLTEDTNAERDLRAGGYRDRLLVELAQNAADAAALAGRQGHLRVTVTGGELRVANTGAPLDEAGVAALASLRASAKPEGTVGRFGVGFAAVLAVTSEPRIVSRTGGVVFSERRTKAEAGAGDVPVLRLPWPPGDEEPPVPDGFDTEVRLPLTVPAGDLLATIAAEVPDLLLALPWLARVDVDGRTWTRSAAGADSGGGVVTLSTPETTARWLTHAADGVVWALPVDGSDGETPMPRTEDVLHTPTPTDERLSLPARLFAPVPVEPSRRRVLTAEQARPVLAVAARIYPGLARRLVAVHRPAAVPAVRFPLSEVDAELRDLVLSELSEQDWLPAAAGGDVAGGRARVLPVDAPELVALLADVVPGLAAACGPGAARLLETVGARAIGVAETVEALTGVERTPAWWHGLYDALLAAVERREVDPAELGALPVPLADGRTVPGPRGALLPDPALTESGLPRLGELDVVGLHLVHPDAAHPLLERLGSDRAGPAELLAAPALREAVERSVEDAVSGVDVRPLVDVVLRLSGHGDAAGLAALALPARSGWRRADELVLPGAPVLDVFDREAVGVDGALDVLDETFAESNDRTALTALGVLDSFALVVDDEPAGADHELPDEAAWWDAETPARVYAVRDLDLVADDAWPAAVRLLAQRPETWRALTERGGHAPWWLARFALLGGRAPMEWRMPAAHDLTGLFDPVPDVGLSPDQLAAVGVRGGLPDVSTVDSDDVEDLCDRLADPERSVPLGLTLRVHRLVGEYRRTATATGAPDPPDRVRTLDGTVTDADDVAVLDGPWLLGAVPPTRFAACAAAGTDPACRPGTGGGSDVGTPGGAPVSELADAFDLPLATEVIDADVSSAGEFAAWPDLPAVVEVAELLGAALPDGGVVVHDHLTVAGADVGEHDVAVPWWCRPGPHDTEVLHATDTSDGLARAFAWAAGLWPRRWEIAALLDDPDPRTLLG
ncbi:sacsin N-terminal ATP-binding-like domain-containing protein [Prauserella alba]|uniref:Molecular chaperone Hsp90 n=1 Tax=Prauserella alba TaxID=176898 RepID=A0ABN1VAT1_9PSEU|nr:molecular chaperone Hsp90 [Prauserella alba]MCP2181445.1 Histidine kinase-, DNA gyrase B-, and HSP90-like ATPase [Prauserella alba]